MFDFDRHPISSLLAALVSAVLVVAALAMFIWGLTTNFSYWWGQQAGQQENNSSQNWIPAQRAFHQEINDVDNYKIQIAAATDSLEAFDRTHPNISAEDGLVGMQDAQEQRDLRSNLTGVTQQCLNTVGQYNTDAQSFLTENWRDAQLPDHLTKADCGL